MEEELKPLNDDINEDFSKKVDNKFEELNKEVDNKLQELDNLLEPKEVLLNTIVKLNLKDILEKEIENNETLNKIQIKVDNQMKQFILLLLKEEPTYFAELEKIIEKLLADNVINSKDIPELLVGVTLTYKLVEKNKHAIKKADYYDIVKTLIQISFEIFLEKKCNPEQKILLEQLLAIINASIDLIKLKEIKPHSFIKKIFKCLSKK